MSEMSRRRRPEEEQRGRMAGAQAAAPQLNVPQREDAALEAEAGRLQGMADRAAARPANEAAIPGERAVRTAEEEQAYNLGQKMGAKSIADMMNPGRIGAEEQQKRGVTEERLIEAERLLMEYKAGKSSVDRRIIAAQQWWKMRNWEQIENERGVQGSREIKGSTAWLWSCVVGKHAEAMESYPEPVILPRMEEDKAEAEILSDILPVILKINGFEKVYNLEQWQKFQEGTGGYYVGWDKTKLGGLGDISVRNISLLNLFWEPGCEDIQESENLFYVQIVNTKQLEAQYPQLKGKLQNAYLQPSEYRKDDSVNMAGKSVLVDWYYHTWDGMKKVLHYCQFVNHEIIYSTENNGDTEGLYADGDYPFVLDPLYPVHGSPAGYGLIDIGRDAQTDIDTLNQAMVQNAVVTSTPRFFIQQDGAINEDEFADWYKPFVHTNGGLGDTSIRPITTNGIQGSALSMLSQKIDELKFVTGNTDIQSGSAPSGVTAASAIAALQEAHGRTSKDSTKSAYRAFDQVSAMCIERIRQFYDMPRQFRILGPNGQQKFLSYNNARLKEQEMLGGMGLETGYRKPVFDIDVRSERENAYTKMSQNELAVQFMQMGVFNPQATDQTLMMLDMMDFRGKDELMNKIQQNGTIMEALMKVGQIAMGLSAKYDPAIAQQLAPILQSIGMDAGGMAGGAGNALQNLPKGEAQGEPSDSSGIVRNARERSRNAVAPE